MGLDMYLSAEKYLGHYEFQRSMKDSGWREEYDLADSIIQAFPKLGEMLDKQSPTLTVGANIGYWRKANAIHQWFVEKCQGGVDECQETYIPTERLQELKEACYAVKADPSLAGELLPTTSGFFFGSTEYDEWYWADIDQTLEIVKKAISLAEEGWTITYHSSW